MSRRSRGKRRAHTVDATIECDWDEEAIENARRQARDLADSDPDASRQLMAQADAACQSLYGQASEPYDPMQLYARILRFYNGGITDSDLDRMDYRRFLGYVREAEELSEEERREMNKGRETSINPSDMTIAQEYTGETIRII